MIIIFFIALSIVTNIQTSEVNNATASIQKQSLAPVTNEELDTLLDFMAVLLIDKYPKAKEITDNIKAKLQPKEKLSCPPRASNFSKHANQKADHDVSS